MAKSFAIVPPRKGLTINMDSVAGAAFIGTASTPRLNLSSAAANHKGCPQISAPEASAMYSREREIAIWMSIAAIGPRIIMSSIPRWSFVLPRPCHPQKETELRQIGDCSAEGGSDRLNQNVPMFYMREFMADNTGKLFPGQES